ncbi:PAS domain S-box protein [bacterium]|nr:PAS domain S-box protein [bacterium]
MKPVIKVLMVEDSSDDAALLLLELRRKGYDPDCARVDKMGDLETALQDQKWDLVICDYCLPNLDGLRVLRYIRERDEDLPVILVSGHVSDEMAVNVMRAGAQDFIHKDNLVRLGPVIERELKELGIRKQQKQSEILLKRFGMVIEQTSEIVVITDTDGTIIYVNPAFERITGYSKEEAIGQNPRILKSEQHGSRFYQDMWRCISSGKSWQGRLTNQKKDGTHFVEEATISPIFSEQGEIINYVAVKRDISEQLKMEEQLEHARKMETVGRLTGGIAHDFNNLITPILGFSEMLARKIAMDDPKYKFTQQIIDAAKRASKLTRQLLTFSRKQVIKTEPMDLNENVKSMESILKQTVGDDIALKLDLSPLTGLISADSTQIEQIVVNLAANARDAMPDGGSLHFITESFDTHRAENPPHDLAPGFYTVLKVKDTGEGIAQEEISKIFDPFFTTKKVGEGTGLGLATVYGIVKQHKGKIYVDSEIGKGTEFAIYFPQIEHQAKEKSPFGEEEAEKTILLAIEDETKRFLLDKMLRENKYTVYVAHSKEEMQAYFKSQKPLDLLIQDFSLKELPISHEDKPKIKILHIAIGSETEYDNAVYLLPRPFTLHSALEKVNEILAGKTTISAA